MSNLLKNEKTTNYVWSAKMSSKKIIFYNVYLLTKTLGFIKKLHSVIGFTCGIEEVVYANVFVTTIDCYSNIEGRMDLVK